MRKHLLKKASKWRRLAILTKFFRKRRSARWKKFYNPTYKELQMASQPSINHNFSSPVSNLESLLSRRFCSTHPLIPKQYIKRKKFGKKHRRLKIIKIKFKGSSTWWRRARVALLESLNLKFRYQHRLTKFIVNYKNILHNKFVPIFEMRLLNVLIRTRFILDKVTATQFIDSQLIFINGVCCINRDLQIFANDLLQLIVTFKYYIVFRWLLNNMAKIKKRIKRASWKNKHRKRDEHKQWSHRLQKWVLPHKYLNLDIAKYLEVDFFTLSAYVLYDPFLWNDLDHYNILNVRYGIINVYNWKYIT
jgi:ribosomal protein S4